MDSIGLLKRYTRHKNVEILNSENEAVLEVLRHIKRINPRKRVIIPNQGGWLKYEKQILKIGFDVVRIRTDKGVISLDALNREIADAAALLITSFAGYYAEQPLEQISKICKQNHCLLVEDASGSIGDNRLCNGILSDIIIGSFGPGKIVDYGNYAFISSNFNLRPGMIVDEGLFNKLRNAPTRLLKLLRLNESVKFDLQKYNIFHRDKRGLNVVVEYNPEIITYCQKKDYEYIICPNDMRVSEPAISIELKKLG